MQSNLGAHNWLVKLESERKCAAKEHKGWSMTVHDLSRVPLGGVLGTDHVSQYYSSDYRFAGPLPHGWDLGAVGSPLMLV